MHFHQDGQNVENVAIRKKTFHTFHINIRTYSPDVNCHIKLKLRGDL